MKGLARFVFLFTLFFPFSLAGFSQDSVRYAYLQGSWVGKLKVQAIELTLVINFRFNGKDSLIVTLDSPDQGARDLPTSKVMIREDSIIVESSTLRAIYAAKISDDRKTLDGIWRQNLYSLPLVLEHQKEKYTVNRPQEPKPPYPYREENVIFTNPSSHFSIGATVTIPEGKGSFPAVVLITGSGAQNRNEEIFQHKPFLVLADYLTRHGIEVLRYDDRGVGLSGGNFLKATTLDFSTDAEAAFQYLKRRPEVDSTRTGLVGHSEGGIIASIVASQDPSVAFIVLMAGTGVPGEKILLEQSELISRKSGVPEKEIALDHKLNEKVYSILKKIRDDEKAKEKIGKLLKKNNPKLTEQELNLQLASLTSPWFRTFLTLNPFDYLLKVKCPVLALDGELDLQVPPKENLEAIERALIMGGNPHYETVLFPKLNHLFQTATTGLPDEYGKIEETLAPEVIEKIADWVSKNPR
jgi:fermentation-respiration switch protein FrsA (DUF1100 family)